MVLFLAWPRRGRWCPRSTTAAGPGADPELGRRPGRGAAGDGSAAPGGQAHRRQRPGSCRTCSCSPWWTAATSTACTTLALPAGPRAHRRRHRRHCGLHRHHHLTAGPTPRVLMGGTAARSTRTHRRGERGNGFELQHRRRLAPPDPVGDRHTAWVRKGWTDLRPRQQRGVLALHISDEGAAGVFEAATATASAPDRPQGPLRPGQPVPHERQHPADGYPAASC